MPYHHELTMSQETATPPRIKITWLIGTLAAFAIFAIIGGYSSRMTWNYSDYDQQRADQRYQTLAKVRHDEQAQITATEWVDQDKGVVRIPVDQAMAREVDVLKPQPTAMGCEIAGAVPAPAPATTNAAPAPAPAPATNSTAATPPADKTTKPEAKQKPSKPSTP
jgi:hypothetical protein